MKRRLAIVLLLLLALLLSACGEKAAPTQEELEASFSSAEKLIVMTGGGGNQQTTTELEGNVYKISVYDSRAVLFKEAYEKNCDPRSLEGWDLVKESAGIVVSTCRKSFDKAGYDQIKVEYTIYGKPLSSVSKDKMDDVLYKYSDGKVVYDWSE